MGNNDEYYADNFTFASRRHVGCAFSVTLYVNGCQSTRLSACCECRYSPGSRLGGKHGHFALVSVSSATPCYRSTMPSPLLGPARGVVCFLSFSFPISGRSSKVLYTPLKVTQGLKYGLR